MGTYTLYPNDLMENMMNIVMRNFLIVLAFVGILFSLASLAHADDLGLATYNMTPEQKAELILKAQEIKKASEKMTPADLEEYANLGQKYGIALVSTAKELGKSVDELMNTNVGKIATFLIIWKVMGETVLGFIVGMGWFTVTNSLWIYVFRRLVLKTRGYKEKLEDGKVIERTYERQVEEDNSGTKWAMGILFLLLNGIGLLVVL